MSPSTFGPRSLMRCIRRHWPVVAGAVVYTSFWELMVNQWMGAGTSWMAISVDGVFFILTIT